MYPLLNACYDGIFVDLPTLTECHENLALGSAKLMITPPSARRHYVPPATSAQHFLCFADFIQQINQFVYCPRESYAIQGFERTPGSQV